MNPTQQLKTSLIVFFILVSITDIFAQIKPLQVDCPVDSFTPTQLNAGNGAGQVYPNVTVSTLNNCVGYTVTENYSWLSFAKNGLELTFTVQANTGPARTGYVWIGTLDYPVTITQACGGLPGAAGTITGNNSICPGQTGVSYSVGAISGATGYSWTLPPRAILASGDNTTSILVDYPANAISGNISVAGTNACGSGSPSPDYPVTVNSISQPGSISGTTSVCQGSIYTYSVTPVSGASSYIWTLPPGASGSSTTNSINVTFGTGVGTISVTARNSFGCTSTPSTLNITPTYIESYTITTGNQALCPGTSFNINLNGSSPGTVYLPLIDNEYRGGYVNGTGSNLTFGPFSTPGTYTVKAQKSGCELLMNGSTVISNYTASVAPSSINANPPSVCIGQSTTLTPNGGSLGTDGAVWKWYTGNCGTTLVCTGNSYTPYLTSNTTYYLRAEGSCVNSYSSCVPIAIDVIPPVSITSQPVNTTISLGQDATFSVVASGGLNLQYRWQSSINGIDSWTDLTALPAVGFQTSTLTIKGSSTTFEDKYYRCYIMSTCAPLIFSEGAKILLSFPGSGYLTGIDIPDPENRNLTVFPVGTSNGSVSVNPVGGSSYNIPLEVPPGVNGLAPNLSIDYSSNNGNDIAGFGWQLSGLSVISLGARSPYLDPAILDNFDRYYLDGQRLQPNIHFQPYGAPDTQYQTENDIFTRVTPKSVNSYGPTWFSAETKTGLIFEYGNSPASRQRIGGSLPVMNWYVSRISDLFGNQINFSYIQDHFSVYPSEITYGPNTISFSYKQRSDIDHSPSKTTAIEQWLLLDKIVIKYNSTITKTYEFKQSYQGTNYNMYSLLNEVIEYGLGSSRLNSSAFSYQIPDNVSFTQTTYNQTTYAEITYKSKLIPGDFNGDGKADFLCLPDASKDATWTGMKIYIGDGSDNFTNPISSTLSLDISKLRDIRTMDLNGDGIDDILYEYQQTAIPTKSDFNYIICDGTSLSASATFMSQYDDSHTGMTGKARRNINSQEDDNERGSRNNSRSYLGKNNLSSISPSKTKNVVDSDINGDGMNDVIINDATGYCQIWYLNNLGVMTKLDGTQYSNGILASDLLSGDFNGDGFIDLWSFTSTGLEIYEYQTSGPAFNRIYNSTWPTNQHYFTLGDFNADGKVDIFLYGYKDNQGVEWDWSDWQIQLSTGSSFEPHSISQKKANLKNDYVRIGDFNGDGASDIMVTSKNLSWNGSYFYISTNNGTALSSVSLLGYPTASHNFYLADYNGDGSTDFMCTDGVSPWWNGYQIYKSIGKTSILMTKSANGLGVLTKLNYTTLSQAPVTIYKRGTGATRPVTDFQGPWSIVSSIQVDNGKGTMNTQNYYYEGAKIHLKGKGFLGYSKLRVSDVTSGIDKERVSSYDMTYFYPKLLKSYSKLTGVSDTLELTTYSWTHIVLSYDNDLRFISYPNIIKQINKLTGQTVTTTIQNDNYNFPTSIIKSYSNGPTETTTNIYDHRISSSQWLLGRPISSTVTYTGSSPIITRSGTRIFDPNTNNLTSETWFTGVNQITKTYNYFTNGNSQNVISTANGKSRTVSFTYESDNVRVHTTTDQLSHVTTNTYYGNGWLNIQQDYLGNTATYVYDNFGRTTSISSSDGSQMSTVYAWESPTGNPLLAQYSVLKTGNDGSQQKSWYDKLGREIRSDVKGFDGTMIYTTTSYNTKGQVESVSEPYFSNGSPLLNTFLYDSYGRRTSLSRPSGNNSTWVYNSNSVTETTGGKSFTKTFSSDGTLASATDAGGTINYTYYNDGKPKDITAPGGIVTSMHYDAAGNQDQLSDPSAGITSYTYNGFGELTLQTNALNQTTQILYLDDGRIDKKILSVEGTTTYTYNTNKQLTGISSPGTVSRAMTYDTKGRIATSTETIPGASASLTTITYDTKGRLNTITHPSTIVETRSYNSNGYLYKVAAGGADRWTTLGMNARQQVTSGRYGTNLSATYGFDNFGYPVSSVTGTIQNYSYNFNPVTGNLTWRQNNKYTGLKEDFNYDNLDRLDDVKKGGIMTLDMAYEGNKGGITTKSDVGTLVYNTSGKPYAVSSINPTTGLTPGAAQAITYTSFQKVSTISENNYSATFTYNADDSRAKMVVKQNTTTLLTRWYPTNSYIKETAGSTTREYTFIGGDAYSAPVVAIKQGSTTTWYYILRDYLGSITHLVKSTTVTSAYAEYSYDAWGRMRNPSTWAIYAPGSEPALFLAGRGYTGHEHLPWFNLINMNGRVYDPLVGMFLSPDNYIQNPGATQSFNRYGYCLNNPLKFTDPSGMLMAAADFGRDIDAYQNWMCDVAGSYHYTGGGGGGPAFTGADQNYAASYIYGSNIKFYGYYDYSKTGAYISKYDGHSASFEEYYANKIAPDLAEFAQAYVDRKTVELQNFNNTLSGAMAIESPLIAGIGMGVYNSIFCSPCFQFKIEFALAMNDFYRNYMDMRKADFIGADKYFHCKANFQAASRGPGGVFFAVNFGYLRELTDNIRKGGSYIELIDSMMDLSANKWGREQVGKVTDPCKACEIYRPIGLPSYY